MARHSDRRFDELRNIRITRSYTKHAEGSVLVEFGDTKVLCTASVEEKVPGFLRGQGRGWLTAEYGMLPRATDTRTARAAAGAVVAVGTTSLRALESAARSGNFQAGDVGLRSGAGETDLFITPGYRFQIVDRLITNFHLPKSTLLMLVGAFAGIEAMRAAYGHAIAGRYRFFSYGDAMLIGKRSG